MGLSAHAQEASAAPPPLAARGVHAESVRDQTGTVPDQARRSGAVRPKTQRAFCCLKGFKAEIVISEPDTINPVGMTFDPDGNLYVMEWRPGRGHRRPVVRGEGNLPLPRRHDQASRDDEEVHHRPHRAVPLQRRHRKVRQAADDHFRRAAVEHHLARGLPVRHPVGAPCGGGNSRGPAARGTCAKSSRRASAASTTTRFPG